jgi:hypothetical protein
MDQGAKYNKDITEITLESEFKRTRLPAPGIVCELKKAGCIIFIGICLLCKCTICKN